MTGRHLDSESVGTYDEEMLLDPTNRCAVLLRASQVFGKPEFSTPRSLVSEALVQMDSEAGW